MQEGKVFQIRKADDIKLNPFLVPSTPFVLTVTEPNPDVPGEPSVSHFAFDAKRLDELADEVEKFVATDHQRLKVQVADLTRELERERSRMSVTAGVAMPAGTPVYLLPNGQFAPKVTPETIGKLEAERDAARKEARQFEYAWKEDGKRIVALGERIERESREHSRIIGQRDREISNLRHLREKAWKPIEMIAQHAGIPIGSDEEFSHFADAVRDKIGKRDMVEEVRRSRDEHFAELVRIRKQFRDFLLGCLKTMGETDLTKKSFAELDVMAGMVHARIHLIVQDRDRMRGMLMQSEKDRHADAQRHDLDRTSWRLADAKLREILGIDVGAQLVEVVKDLKVKADEVDRANRLSIGHCQWVKDIAAMLGLPEDVPLRDVPKMVEESLHAARLVKYPAFKGLGDEDDDDEIDWGDDEVTLNDALDECGANFPPGATITQKVRAVVDEINDRNSLFASVTSLLQAKGVTWGPGAMQRVIEEWDELRRFRDGVGQMVGSANVKDIPQIFAALSRIIVGKQAEEYRIRTEAKGKEFGTSPLMPGVVAACNADSIRRMMGFYGCPPIVEPGYSWRFRRVDRPTVNAPEYDRVIGKDYEEAWDIMNGREGVWMHDPETPDEQSRRQECKTRKGPGGTNRRPT